MKIFFIIIISLFLTIFGMLGLIILGNIAAIIQKLFIYRRLQMKGFFMTIALIFLATNLYALDVKILDIDKKVISQDREYQNVKVKFPSGEIRDVSVEMPITEKSIKEAVNKYWKAHKDELVKEVSTDPLVGQTITVDSG